MFNEELKNSFIQQYTDSKPTAEKVRRIFDIISKYEERWGEDICTKSADDLKTVIDNVLGLRSGPRLTNLSLLRKYSKWCMDNGVPNACDGLFQVKDEGVQRIRLSMVSSPKHLQECLDHAFPPESSFRIDNIYRCFFWMAFAGIDEKDSVLITANHIDSWNRVINFNDKEYPIYDEAVPVFRHLCSANSFLCDFSRYEKIVPRVPGEQILRGVKSNKDLDAATVSHMASRKLRIAYESAPDRMRLTYRSIELSGRFYRIHEEEQKSGSYRFDEALEAQIEENECLSASRKRGIKREYEIDFLRWKAAFEK